MEFTLKAEKNELITFWEPIMIIASLLRPAIPKKVLSGAIAVALTLGCANLSYAGNREKAWQMFERLTGTPPSNALLATMTDCLDNGVNSSLCQAGTTVDGVTVKGVSDLVNDGTMQSSLTAAINNSSSSQGASTYNPAGAVAATFLAMQDKNFLNVKVKNMVIPWTNKDQTVFFPFNDAAALLIGLIRDGTDFRKSLYGDIYYDDPNITPPTRFVFPPSSSIAHTSDNTHFETIENQDLALKNVLVATTQTGVTGMPAEGVAGVMTTRAMQRAFFYGGTNRAMLRFTFINFLCNDFGQIKDITSNPERIRQDPSRSPGGDSSVFLNNCIGCHSGMDGLAGAFAYYNWGPYQFDANATADSQAATYADQTNPNPAFTLSGKQFASTRVMPKYLQNFLSFPGGYQTTDDSWINYWRVGLDANLGWEGNTTPHIIEYQPNSSSNPYQGVSSNGHTLGSAAQLGYELSHTEAFARCQVLQVYRHTCMNDPTEPQIEKLVTDFKGSNYNMLTAFSDAAIACSSN